MLWALIGLWVLVKLIQGAWWCLRSFWAWLGRGKAVHGVAERNLVSEEVRQTIEAIDAVRAAQRLGKGQQGPVIRLSHDMVKEVRRAQRFVRDDFLDRLHIGWYQITIIFFIGSVAGLVLEEIWMLASMGVAQYRSGLVWGPLSPLYGVGAVLLTITTFEMRSYDCKGWQVFLVSLALGGLLEQITGWGMESLMDAISWDYVAGHVPGAITKWVAVPFLIFWGVLGYVWYRWVMPELLYALGEPTTRRKYIFALLLAVYLSLDIFMTVACFTRRAARDDGIPPANVFEEWVDKNYSNEFMSSRFQNMVIDASGTRS